jgi:hypothetical protein
VALDSATPYLMVHEGADVGKTAYYALRWENTRGESGPWSNVARRRSRAKAKRR